MKFEIKDAERLPSLEALVRKMFILSLLEEPMQFTMKSDATKHLSDVYHRVPVRLLDSLGNVPINTIGYLISCSEINFVVISGAPLGFTSFDTRHSNPRVEILAPGTYTMELK